MYSGGFGSDRFSMVQIGSGIGGGSSQGTKPTIATGTATGTGFPLGGTGSRSRQNGPSRDTGRGGEGGPSWDRINATDTA